MRRSSDTWILVSLFVLLVVGAYLVSSPRSTAESKAPTSYNADPAGTKAFYTLLGRIGYTTDRLRKPYTEIPKRARMLVVVQPGERKINKTQAVGQPISEAEREALARWVAGGGVVLFVSDDLRGVPWRFKEGGPLGEGHVYALSSVSLISNKGMRKPDNASQLVEIVSRSVSKGDLIVFDEYHHGLTERRPLLESVSRQGIVGSVVVLLAALVLCYSRGRRFGAVRDLPAGEGVRPGFEFVESVGRLYRRAHATDLAAEILCDSFRHGLCLKLGLPSDAPRAVVVRRMGEDFTDELCERVDGILADCERSEAGVKPSESELLDMAVEIRSLEKELGIGAVDG